MYYQNQGTQSFTKLRWLLLTKNYYSRQAKLFARSAESSESLSPLTMLSSLRVLAFRVVEQGRRILLQHPIKTRPGNPGSNSNKETDYLYSIQSESGVKPIERGVGRGPYETRSINLQASSGPFVGLLRRLGPLVSGAVRRLILPQNFASYSYRDTAPLFALVGVTLLSSQESEDEEGLSRKYKGFVTKEEELEALCGTIRQAAYHTSWLYDSPTSFLPHGLDGEGKSHVYSLKDLNLSGVIGQGCNAVVYGAKWNQQVSQNEGNKSCTEEDASTSGLGNVSSSSEQETILDSASDLSSSFSPSYSSLADEFSIDDYNSICSQYTSNPNLSRLTFDGSSRPFSNSSINLTSLRDFQSSNTSGIFEAQHECQFKSPISNVNNNVSSSQCNSLSEIVSSGKFGTPQRKRVHFSPPATEDSSTLSAVAENDDWSNPSSVPTPSGPSHQYPLAVKLVFNYEAASNAPAILSALYRELMPARSLQLDDLYTSWKNSFFGEQEHKFLPYHPNIVDMPCAFVDRVPMLKDSLQLYPNALPRRLNPEGWGRNMSLFCVMRRYDLSLDDYLHQHPQLSARTSLLLLTQLLEALLHLSVNHISHRDLKPDNVLINLVDGVDSPWLVLTDFGCCLPATSRSGLIVPFVSREAEPRQGNPTLMAPEVKLARPGRFSSVNFTRCDFWAAGTLAYQFYGLKNPFFRDGEGGKCLDSGTYKESQLPGLMKTKAPPAIRKLVADLLRRKPNNRPDPAVAATICQLVLWGPSSWLNRHSPIKPRHNQVMEWLLSLTAKVICEKRHEGRGAGLTEHRMVSTFLSRVHYNDIIEAINSNKAF